MADIIIPLPDPAGYWHFTYITTDLLDGRWYGGKRSTKKHPLSDRYLGKGVWVRAHPDRTRLRREIVAFYGTSADVFAGEAELVTWAKVKNDPLCMNRRDGGLGMTAEAAQRLAVDPAWREANAASTARTAANPKWQKNHSAAMQRMHADPIYRAALTAGFARMAANPEWQKQHAAFIDRRTADPKWQKNHAAVCRELHTNPEWIANRTSAIRISHAKPEFRANQSAILKRIASDPEWRRKNAAILKRIASDPEWQRKNAAQRERIYAARRVKKALLAG